LFTHCFRGTGRRAAVQRRVRPCLEGLEDRITPTVLFTTQNAENATNPNNNPVLGQTNPGVPVYMIYWGSYWNTAQGQANEATYESAMHNALYNTPYLDGLHQYGPQYRAFQPNVSGDGYNDHVAITGYDPNPNGISDSDLQGVINDAIYNHSLPPANHYSNTGIYFVVTPPNTFSSSFSSDSAYHTYFNDQNGIQTIYGWAGADEGLDNFTTLLSHETVEAMTDPLGNAWQVDPRSSSAWNEISDNEAQNYTYRLNGYQVQSYWSQANGAYMVSDGNTQTVTDDNGTLTVNGDQLGSGYNDNITISTTGSGGVQVNENGEVFAFDPGQISTINVNTGGGSNTVNVQSEAWGVTLNINGGGSDTVNIGNNGSVQGILGTVNIANPPNYNTITVDASQDPASNVTLSTFTGGDGASWGSISGLSLANINYKYGDTHSLTVNTGAAGTTVNVQGTGVTTNLVGHGSTTVNVGNGGTVGGIWGTLNISNPPDFDAITVDDSADATVRTATLSTFTGSDGASWGSIGGLGSANINYKYGDTHSVTVYTPAASGNTVNVLDTGVSTTLVGSSAGSSTVNVEATHRALNVDNGGGFNTVYVGSNGSSLGGTAQNIHGTVDAYGAGQTWLYVDNSADATGHTASLQTGALTGLAPASVFWTPSSSTTGGVDYLDVLGGSGGNTFNVAANNNFFYYTDVHGGSGNNTYNVTGNTGTLHLYGGTGNDLYHFVANNPLGSAAIGDSGGTDTVSFAGTNTGVTASLGTTAQQTVNANLKLTLSSLSSIENLTGGNGNDKLTGNALANVITGGAGNDTFVATAGGDTFIGGGGKDTYLFVANTNLGSDTITDSSGQGTITFAGTNLGCTLNLSTTAQQTVNANLKLTLSSATGIQNVTGGNGNDLLTGNALNNTFTETAGSNTYVFKADTSLGSDVINDKTGKGTITFAGTTSAVTLNLGTTAQQTVNGNLKLTLTSATGIQNVTGGNGNDVLTGNSLHGIIRGGNGNNTLTAGSGGEVLVGGSGSNRLIGGAGRSILIGGSGTDNITGGAKGDIVIGGSTSFDANNAALFALLAEWQRTDLSYSQRVQALRNGVVDSNGHTDALVWGTTVLDNHHGDTLRGEPVNTPEPGGNELDWFFANLAQDSLPDRIASESVD
jgi:hypothetical protein